MAIRLNSGRIIHNLFTAVVLWISVMHLHAQPQLIASAQPGKINDVYSDRLGDFYVMLESGTLVKYDTMGIETGRFVLTEPASVIDPWFGLQTFLYFPKSRTYTLLDHSLNKLYSRVLAPEIAIEPYMVCPGNLNTLWVLDSADWSIKKVEPGTSRVIVDELLDRTVIGNNPGISQMKEYQNMLFLFDQKRGIHIYNILGKFITTIPDWTGDFSFLGQELYGLNNGRLVLYDLYDAERRELELPEQADYALATDDRFFIGKGETVKLYRIPVE